MSKLSNEEEIIVRAKAGDISAFEIIIEAFQDVVYTKAYYIMGNKDDAMDIMQSVFLKVFLSIRRFKAKSLLSTWIYRITVNSCLRELKKRKRRPPAEVDINTTPTDKTIQVEEENIALQILSKLPEPYRIILILREMDELSFKEIADQLKIKENLAKVRAFRAKKRFRQLMKEYLKDGN
jgi:RNA polymerase sigma-70 factor, ECF subfamily